MIKVFSAIQKKYFDNTVEFSKLSKSFLLWVIGLILVYAGNIYLTKSLGFSLYGKYTVFISWVSLVSIALTFGWEGYFMQKIPMLAKNEEGKFFGKVLIKKALQTVLVLFIFLAAFILLDWYSNQSILNFQHLSEVVFFLYFTLVFAVITLIKAFIRIFHIITPVQWAEDVLKPFLLLLAVLYFYYYRLTISLSTWYFINSIIFFGIMVYLVILAYKTHSINFSIQQSTNDSADWVSRCFYFMCIALGYTVFTKMELLFLGYYSQNEAAAKYQILLRISDIVILPDFLFNYFLPQKFSYHFANKNIPEAKKLFQNAAKTIALLQFLCFTGIAAIGYFYLMSFGIATGYMYLLLLILASSQIFYSLFGSSNLVLKTSGNEKYSFYALLIVLIAEFIANAIFVKQYGIIAAVSIAWLSVLMYTLILSFLVHKKLGFNITFTRLLFFVKTTAINKQT